MISAATAELQGRDLISQPMLLDPRCFLHSSGTGPLYCQQHFAWPSAATWEWEETTYNVLITTQGHETLEQGEGCVKDELPCLASQSWWQEVTGLILTRIRISVAERCSVDSIYFYKNKPSFRMILSFFAFIKRALREMIFTLSYMILCIWPWYMTIIFTAFGFCSIHAYYHIHDSIHPYQPQTHNQYSDIQYIQI